ncbi:MAG: T9SS type A sorting domain-containing protein [Chitinophagales bacterium]|nr:T9SS type A sorting domain-containing protein [Chitinophagales bacterium]
MAQEIIEVAPNPTNGIINFTLSGDQAKDIERVDLFNLNGQLLQTVQGQNQSFVELNMSEQQAGLYLARVYLSGSGKFVLKKIAKVQ